MCFTLANNKKKMHRFIIVAMFTLALISCDKTSMASSENSGKTNINTGLNEAVRECEDHLNDLTKLGGPEMIIGSAELKREYMESLEDWFRDLLIARAKLIARGATDEQSDLIGLKIIESLSAFHTREESAYKSEDPDFFTAIEEMMSKYGYLRKVRRNKSERTRCSSQSLTRFELKLSHNTTINQKSKFCHVRGG